MALLAFVLLPLTAELLTENASKHGISGKIEGAAVRICGKQTAKGYQVIAGDDVYYTFILK